MRSSTRKLSGHLSGELLASFQHPRESKTTGYAGTACFIAHSLWKSVSKSLAGLMSEQTAKTGTLPFGKYLLNRCFPLMPSNSEMPAPSPSQRGWPQAGGVYISPTQAIHSATPSLTTHLIDNILPIPSKFISFLICSSVGFFASVLGRNVEYQSFESPRRYSQKS